MAKCSLCGEEVPGRGGLFRHSWDEHPVETESIRKAAQAKSVENRRKPRDDGNAPKGEGKASKGKGRGGFYSGGPLATAGVTGPAAVVFSLGSQKIELDPGDFYETYLLCQDIKLKLQLKDTFSAILKDAVSLAWRWAMMSLVNPKLQDG